MSKKRLCTFLGTFCAIFFCIAAVASEKKEEVKIDPMEMKVKEKTITLRPFLVPIIKGPTMAGFVLVAVVLEQKQEKNILEISLALPRARDEAMTYLFNLFGSLWTTDAHVNTATIRNKMVEIFMRHMPTLLENVSLNNVEVRMNATMKRDPKPFIMPKTDIL